MSVSYGLDRRRRSPSGLGAVGERGGVYYKDFSTTHKNFHDSFKTSHRHGMHHKPLGINPGSKESFLYHSVHLTKEKGFKLL